MAVVVANNDALSFERKSYKREQLASLQTGDGRLVSAVNSLTLKSLNRRSICMLLKQRVSALLFPIQAATSLAPNLNHERSLIRMMYHNGK